MNIDQLPMAIGCHVNIDEQRKEPTQIQLGKTFHLRAHEATNFNPVVVF